RRGRGRGPRAPGGPPRALRRGQGVRARLLTALLVVVVVTAGAIAGGGREARADDDRQYRLELFGPDLAPAPVLPTGAWYSNEPALLTGVGVFLIGAPIVHLGNSHGWTALASLGLRAPIAFVAGMALCKQGGGCERTPELAAYGFGALAFL